MGKITVCRGEVIYDNERCENCDDYYPAADYEALERRLAEAEVLRDKALERVSDLSEKLFSQGEEYKARLAEVEAELNRSKWRVDEWTKDYDTLLEKHREVINTIEQHNKEIDFKMLAAGEK